MRKCQVIFLFTRIYFFTKNISHFLSTSFLRYYAHFDVNKFSYSRQKFRHFAILNTDILYTTTIFTDQSRNPRRCLALLG